LKSREEVGHAFRKGKGNFFLREKTREEDLKRMSWGKRGKLPAEKRRNWFKERTLRTEDFKNQKENVS